MSGARQTKQTSQQLPENSEYGGINMLMADVIKKNYLKLKLGIITRDLEKIRFIYEETRKQERFIKSVRADADSKREAWTNSEASGQKFGHKASKVFKVK